MTNQLARLTFDHETAPAFGNNVTHTVSRLEALFLTDSKIRVCTKKGDFLFILHRRPGNETRPIMGEAYNDDCIIITIIIIEK